MASIQQKSELYFFNQAKINHDLTLTLKGCVIPFCFDVFVSFFPKIGVNLANFKLLKVKHNPIIDLLVLGNKYKEI